MTRRSTFEHAEIALDEIGPCRVEYFYDPATRLRAAVVIDTLRFPVAGGGVRMAADVTLVEIARLARAMTYKYALLEMPCGGAKAGIWLDPGDPARADTMAAFVEAIRPLAERGAFFPGPDMGTTSSDFDPLYGADSPGAKFAQTIHEGMPLELQLTGAGVVASAAAACGVLGWPLRGATLAIEGFGKVGAGAAKFFSREGAKLVAFTTVRGGRYEPNGFDVDALLAAREKYGDALVEKITEGRSIPREELFALPVDVLVPGARPDVLHERNVDRVRARLIAPAANIPYAKGIPERLGSRGIVALPEFVTNAGGVLAAAIGLQGGSVDDAFRTVRERVGDNVRRVLAFAKERSCGAYEAAVRMAHERVTGEGAS